MYKSPHCPPQVLNAKIGGLAGQSQKIIQKIIQKIRWGLRIQSLTGMVMAIALLTVSPLAAYSSLFGSLAAFIPAFVFAVLVAGRIGKDSAAFLGAAMVGEAVKLLLTALICLAVFLWVKPLAAGWFFGGMIAVIFAGYISSVRGVDF